MISRTWWSSAALFTTGHSCPERGSRRGRGRARDGDDDDDDDDDAEEEKDGFVEGSLSTTECGGGRGAGGAWRRTEKALTAAPVCAWYTRTHPNTLT